MVNRSMEQNCQIIPWEVPVCQFYKGSNPRQRQRVKEGIQSSKRSKKTKWCTLEWKAVQDWGRWSCLEQHYYCEISCLLLLILFKFLNLVLALVSFANYLSFLFSLNSLILRPRNSRINLSIVWGFRRAIWWYVTIVESLFSYQPNKLYLVLLNISWLHFLM